MQMTANADSGRFQTGADKYATYLETSECRLRCDLAFANPQDFLPLPQTKLSLRPLDLGCGTGAASVRLARLGIHTTLLDSSPAMLDIAKCAAGQTGVSEKIALQHGDATRLTNLFHPASFDVVLGRKVLQYLDDPIAVLRDAARALRDSSAILLVLVRSRFGEVFKAAIQAGDLTAAETTLTAEWGQESLYGGPVRLFTSHSLPPMRKAASLAVIACRRITYRPGFLAARNMRGVLNWSRSWELDRSLLRLRGAYR
jgi:ubiquinone/menaquinone biosynthesis C-methylase UbiE